MLHTSSPLQWPLATENESGNQTATFEFQCWHLCGISYYHKNHSRRGKQFLNWNILVQSTWIMLCTVSLASQQFKICYCAVSSRKLIKGSGVIILPRQWQTMLVWRCSTCIFKRPTHTCSCSLCCLECYDRNVVVSHRDCRLLSTEASLKMKRGEIMK